MRRPIYRLTIDLDAEGMDFIGLVDYPAHGKKYTTMSKAPREMKVERQQFNDEQQIVTGVALATDLLIYRRDDDGFEYDVYFTKEDAMKIMKMFAKNGYHNNVNLMHDMSKKVSDAYMIECYFVNKDMSNLPEALKGQNVRPGSIVFSYWIEGKKTWEFVKKHGAGFSLEGWFKEVLVKFSNQKPKKVKKGTLLQRLFGKTEENPTSENKFDADNKDKYMTATTADGISVYWKELAEGQPLWMIPEGATEEEAVMAQEGEYSFEFEGVMYTVTVDDQGLIASIVEGEEMGDMEQVEEAMHEMKSQFDAQKENFETTIKTMAQEIDDLAELVESLAEKAGFKKLPKSEGGNEEPQWKQMLKQAQAKKSGK